MKTSLTFALCLVFGVSFASISFGAVKNIVLVHGAFADGAARPQVPRAYSASRCAHTALSNQYKSGANHKRLRVLPARDRASSDNSGCYSPMSFVAVESAYAHSYRVCHNPAEWCELADSVSTDYK
jgi:hypothetical protein